MVLCSGMNILSLRKKLGWTQVKLAEYLAVDQGVVSRIENGATINGPIRKLLEQLAREPAQ